MSLDKIIVIIVGVLMVGITYWFFLMRRNRVVNVTGSITIVVSGGYAPEVISIPAGKTTKLEFFRKDSSSCLEEVVISDFKIRKFLPLNEKVFIDITGMKKGEYLFTCGMNMFHGKIIAT